MTIQVAVVIKAIREVSPRAHFPRQICPERQICQEKMSVAKGVPERWRDSWSRIECGESLWKANEQTELILETIRAALPGVDTARIFVPLSGDCPFVAYAAKRGHRVAALDGISIGLDRIRDDILAEAPDAWVVETVIQPHGTVRSFRRATSGTPALETYHADMFGELFPQGPFDAVYDKDAFGAIEPAMRAAYVRQVSRVLRPGGVIVLEAKHKGENASREEGPPFHMPPDELMRWWGPAGFEVEKYTKSFYPISKESHVTQQGYVLRFKGRPSEPVA